ncbi:Gfo/Idh/MocA family oxidoreductase [Plectonema cf. radiosum LEGE 06105]|uniref:Gfo/Idh/MocA family oxidoreductase n=1 Tax=Plectonema cf. radiosum LEGE 06105 TaxID=945769 RepID=A0A8J7EXD3_9CYAN|nr:Gfo/Idh/MocA family oxidoreductase [Plectonema radiosum]MBE9211528.1 Gfo/Idh/MocA family oxidoreductase [Plectonema cf. radiosum LEGE 06105]
MTVQNGKNKLRYAAVGLGWIVQEDVLPAFSNTENSQLAALVSGDATKRKELGAKYQVPTYSYEQYEECLKNENIDAVYIGTPNHLHLEHTVRAASSGVHILCEKPMAVKEDECEEMIRAAKENNVKLMIAYRLHFDKANMEAVRIVQSGQIGEPRIFDSVFSQQVEEGNIRLTAPLSEGGGSVYDMGVYCINAARYLFQDEPIEVFAFIANNGEKRFEQVDEMTSVIMRFPKERLASFTSSFGASSTATFRVIGTKGDLRMDSAYTYAGDLKQQITVEGDTQEKSYSAGDQFGAEIQYFSDCVLNNQEPEPSGTEGLADVRTIRAIIQSAQTGKPVKLDEFKIQTRPTIEQVIQLPAIETPKHFVNAADMQGNS